MTISVADMSRGRWSTDIVLVFGAWMPQHITSYRNILVLQKPCSLDIEGGFARMTRGENAKICSIVNLSSEMPTTTRIALEQQIACNGAGLCI
jgi:hypothetical protein